MNRFYLVLLSLLTLTLAQAQVTTEDVEPVEPPEPILEESDAETQEMDDMDHGEHGVDDAALEEMPAENAANTVMLGDQSVLIEPLVTPNGDFTLGLRAEDMLTGDLALNATTPGGASVASAGVNELGTALLEFGQAENGVYRVSGSYDGADFAFPVSLYTQDEDAEDIEAYLILAPSPTLDNRGMSEVFAYAFEDGESLHNAFSLSYSMEGMQHSSDDDQISLSHTHFDQAYDSVLGETPMSNQTSLGLPMVGTWQVELELSGDEEEILIFNVDMLDEEAAE